MNDNRSPSAGTKVPGRASVSLRAQYGLVILAVLLAGYGLLVLSDEVQRLQYETEENAQSLATLSDTTTEDIWVGRSIEANEIATLWQNQSWRASSAGVGAAEIEVSLRDLAVSNQATNLQLDVNPSPVRMGNAEFLRFSLSAQFPAAVVHKFLVEVGTNRKVIVMSDVQLVAQRDDTYSIRLDGFAPFLQADGGGQ